MNASSTIIVGGKRIAYEIGISQRHLGRLISAGVANISKGRGRTSLLRATQSEIERLRRVLSGEVIV